MKPLIYNDVLAAVSVVSALSPRDRRKAIRTLLVEAELAHAYVRSFHSAHPVFGDGSLMTAALRHPTKGDVRFATEQGRSAWLCVLDAVQRHCAQPDAQLMQRVTVGSNSSRFSAIFSPQSSQ